MRVLVLLGAVAIAAAGGCVKHAPLYCDETHPCSAAADDPSLNFCDLEGTYPASEGHGHTCIANPNDAGVLDGAGADGGVDAMPPDAGCEDGTTRNCGSDEGACEFGVEMCRSSGTWGPCQGGIVPAIETCNMADDDCDGTIDNGTNACGGACVLAALPSSPCDGVDGDFCNEGTWSCATINEVMCSDTTDTIVEDCNTLDDDCDLSIDEGCACVNGLMQTCGTDAGACTVGMQTCSGGMWGTCSGIGPTSETCNSIDDDCNGPADETFTDLGTSCMAGTGACVASGVMVCDGLGTGTQCGATPGTPTPETCNHIDDDCDGVIDNGCPATPTQRFPWNGYTTGSWRANNGMLPPLAVNPERPTLIWEPVATATSYELQIEDTCPTTGFFGCAFASPFFGETTTMTRYTPPTYIVSIGGARAYWRVRACNSIGCSDWSPIRYFLVGRLTNDFNGDAYADIVVGAAYQDFPTMDEGNAFVYYGSAAGLPSTFSLRLDSPTGEAGSWFGASAAAVGDVNGDGYSDAVVGAHKEDDVLAEEGQVFVYYGSASGLPPSPSLTLSDPGHQAGANFGYAVAAAGDVNGDGYMDVLVGAYGQDGTAPDEGAAYVYYGSSTGIPAVPSVTLMDPGDQNGASFGGSVAPCGDMNVTVRARTPCAGDRRPAMLGGCEGLESSSGGS